MSPSDGSQARHVGLARFRLEEHVIGSFRTAWALAEGQPINARHTLMGDVARHAFTFPDSFRLLVDGTVRVWTKAGKDTSTDLYWKRRAAVWNNEGDTAELRDAEGRLVSTFTYSP